MPVTFRGLDNDQLYEFKDANYETLREKLIYVKDSDGLFDNNEICVPDCTEKIELALKNVVDICAGKIGELDFSDLSAAKITLRILRHLDAGNGSKLVQSPRVTVPPQYMDESTDGTDPVFFQYRRAFALHIDHLLRNDEFEPDSNDYPWLAELSPYMKWRNYEFEQFDGVVPFNCRIAKYVNDNNIREVIGAYKDIREERGLIRTKLLNHMHDLLSPDCKKRKATLCTFLNFAFKMYARIGDIESVRLITRDINREGATTCTWGFRYLHVSCVTHYLRVVIHPSLRTNDTWSNNYVRSMILYNNLFKHQPGFKEICNISSVLLDIVIDYVRKKNGKKQLSIQNVLYQTLKTRVLFTSWFDKKCAASILHQDCFEDPANNLSYDDVFSDFLSKRNGVDITQIFERILRNHEPLLDRLQNDKAFRERNLQILKDHKNKKTVAKMIWALYDYISDADLSPCYKSLINVNEPGLIENVYENTAEGKRNRMLRLSSTYRTDKRSYRVEIRIIPEANKKRKINEK